MIINILNLRGVCKIRRMIVLEFFSIWYRHNHITLSKHALPYLAVAASQQQQQVSSNLFYEYWSAATQELCEKTWLALAAIARQQQPCTKNVFSHES